KERDDRYETVRSFLSDLKLLKSRLDFESALARAGQPLSSFGMSDEAKMEIGEAVTTEISGFVDEVIASPIRRSSSRAIDSLAIPPLVQHRAHSRQSYL